MKRAPQIVLSHHDRWVLTRWSRGRASPAPLALRAKIVLLAAEGAMNNEIAARLEARPKTVSLWRKRFAAKGSPGAADCKVADAFAREGQRGWTALRPACHQTMRAGICLTLRCTGLHFDITVDRWDFIAL